MSDPRWLDDVEMRAWRTFLRAHSRLVNRLDDELVAECGISVADFEVLVQLSESPQSALRMSELADRVMLSRSGLTRRVDRLVGNGLVTRRSCSTDRRGSFAVLTSRGLDRLRRVAPIHLRGVREHLIDRLSRDQLVSLADALGPVAEGIPQQLPVPR